MTTFLLIRHATTDAIGKSLIGWTAGCRLNSKGKAQADQLASRLSRLPIRAVYTSPLERAVETANPIASSHGLAPQLVEDLGEMRFGAWEGLTFDELDSREDWRRFNTVRSRVRPPGGETMIEVQTRMVGQIECLASWHPDDVVAVVSHCDPLRASVAHYLGVPLDLLLRFEIDPASVSALEIGAWAPRILFLNGTGDVTI